MTPKSPPKKPRNVASSARSSKKARKGPGGRWVPEVRAQAVELLVSDGMAEAHRVTGVPKATLTTWAKAEGIDLGSAARARTASATEAVRRRAAEVRASTVELLEGHIAQAGHYLTTVAGVNALAAQLTANVDPALIKVTETPFGSSIHVEDKETDEVRKVALALSGLPLAVRDAEGILTRAIHDLQLLKGEATERGEIAVAFNVPRPTPPTSVTVVDVTED